MGSCGRSYRGCYIPPLARICASAECGSYAATFNLGVTVEGIVGPSLVGGFVLAAGTTGWAVLATLFLAAGLAGGAACRWRPEPLGSATGEIVPAAQA